MLLHFYEFNLDNMVQYLVGKELFHNILTGTNAKAGVELYAPQFVACQLGFCQTCQTFHTITKIEAQAIDARNALLTNDFSLASFHPTFVVHHLFAQFWASVKRRLFATDANYNRIFHLLERPGTSSVPVIPLAAQYHVSPSRSPLARVKCSMMNPIPSGSLFAQTGTTKDVSSCKWPASALPGLPDDDDTPLIVRRKKSSTSPQKTLPLPVLVPPPSTEASPSKSSGKGTKPTGQESLITQSVGKLSPPQGADPRALN